MRLGPAGMLSHLKKREVIATSMSGLLSHGIPPSILLLITVPPGKLCMVPPP